MLLMINIIKMSIELGKVVRVYEQSKSVVEAKIQLMEFSSKLSFPQPYNPSQQNLCPSLVSLRLLKIINSWSKKFIQCKELVKDHNKCIKELQSRSSGLKQILKYRRNNTQLLSKENQLLGEIEEMMINWEQKEELHSYYDIKKRKALVKDMSKKLEDLKGSSEKTENSMAPLYAHKLEKEIKETILKVYFSESEIDITMVDSMTAINSYMSEKIQRHGRQVQQIQIPCSLSQLKTKLYSENAEILQRKKKINEKHFNKYVQSLTGVIKKYLNFWNSYAKDLNLLLQTIEIVNQSFEDFRTSLAITENRIYQLLEDIPNSIGTIFRVELIYQTIKVFLKVFQILDSLQKFKQKVLRYCEQVLKIERQAKEYSEEVLREISARQKNFYEFALSDKKFLEESSKAERSINSCLLQTFKEFLIDGFNLFKEIRKFSNKDNHFNEIETYQITKMIDKLIISDTTENIKSQSDENLNEKDRIVTTRMSTRYTALPSSRKKKSHEKNQKIKKIESFIERIEIFKDVNSMFEEFSCALGPKLLLHGKLRIFDQGLYYESFFNKKNLFFGRTQIFIPKNDILEIDEKNTLMIFPDAIEIRTKKGFIYFHALASRKAILTTIMDSYFPENKDEGDYVTELDFKENTRPDLSVEEIQKVEQPHENILFETLFKGVKLNKFFKRYLSDQKFEIRGKIYDNFKSCFLEQIEAINPKSSPLIPEPPAYFCYNNEESLDSGALTSERTHTYGKKIPKIPFVSSGGEGLCEEKQTYYWISPIRLVVESASVVKGFSLTEGMQIFNKIALHEMKEGVKLTSSATIKFSNSSSTNALLKSPAMSNLKSACVKMCEMIEKYEKGKKISGHGKKVEGKMSEQMQELRYEIDELQSKNKKLRRQMKIMAAVFIIVYFLTLGLIFTT